MTDVIVLDSGPLGQVAHPRRRAEVTEWLNRLVQSNIAIVIPEIADYEVRRELIRAGRLRSAERLTELREQFFFLIIQSECMLIAAEFWAHARNQGVPTAPDGHLDADVILAAQARTLVNLGHDVIIATTNTRHLSRFVPAQFWLDIKP
jgi:predicted nucleic acid-binding protein